MDYVPWINNINATFIKNLKSYEKCLVARKLLRTFRFQKYENGTTGKENNLIILHRANVDISVIEIQCLLFFSHLMLFGAEGKVDKWKRLHDVCVNTGLFSFQIKKSLSKK